MKDEMFDFKRNSLLGNVSGKPLCQQYKEAWRKCGDDKEMLIRLALKQQSTPYLSHACYNKLGLSKEYVLQNFGEYINGKRTFDDVEGVNGYTYQLYAGYDKDFEITADVTSFMWSECNVTIPETKCSTLYVSNNSSVGFTLNGFNSIRVYLFDESSITIDDAPEGCDVVVYKYSNRANVDAGKFCFANMKIFYKQLKL